MREIVAALFCLARSVLVSPDVSRCGISWFGSAKTTCFLSSVASSALGVLYKLADPSQPLAFGPPGRAGSLLPARLFRGRRRQGFPSGGPALRDFREKGPRGVGGVPRNASPRSTDERRPTKTDDHRRPTDDRPRQDRGRRAVIQSHARAGANPRAEADPEYLSRKWARDEPRPLRRGGAGARARGRCRSTPWG